MEKYLPKAVFFDLDGTTYQHNIHDVPASTYVALEQMKKMGIKLSGCTSRVPNELVHLPQRFVDLLDGMICCAGGVVFADGKIIQEHRVDLEDAHRIKDFCRENGYVMRWSTAGQEGHIDYWDHEEKLSIFEYLYQMRPSLRPLTDEPVTHLLMFPPMSLEMENTLRGLLKKSNLIVLNSTYEVTDLGVSKASGIREMANYWGIAKNDIVAVGDGKNDIAMFTAANIGIAMGQAVDEVKQAATYVTTPLQEDGFYLAFVHYGIIEDTLGLVK